MTTKQLTDIADLLKTMCRDDDAELIYGLAEKLLAQEAYAIGVESRRQYEAMRRRRDEKDAVPSGRYPSAYEINQMAVAAGGEFHGPIVETLSIPQSRLPEFARALCDWTRAQVQDTRRTK